MTFAKQDITDFAVYSRTGLRTTRWTNFVPTVGAGGTLQVFAAIAGRWRANGEDLEVEVAGQFGASALANDFRFFLPAGFTNKLLAAQDTPCGHCYARHGANTVPGIIMAMAASSAYVQAASVTGAGTGALWSNVSPIAWAGGDYLAARWKFTVNELPT